MQGSFTYLKRTQIFLVFDNASGTYCPKASCLSGLSDLLMQIFLDRRHLYFVTKTFEQTIDKGTNYLPMRRSLF